ncbi:MAG: DUF4097 family beta strand repeat-containing protein [Woeseiaceae bacterium]
MMKKLIAITLSFLLAMPVMAEEVDETLDAAADGQVDISNIAGSISVTGWSRNAVEVTGTLGRNVEELIFERKKDKVTVKVKVPRHGGRGIDSDLHINVPQNSSIDVSAVSADIDVTDVLGEQRLHTVSGDVSTESAGSDVTAASVSGDVEVNGDKSDTDTQASTVSGDVTLFRVSGTVSAESVTGRVIVDEGSFSRADLNVVNGELLFQAGLRKDGKLSAETVNGAVDVELVGDVSATIDVSTVNGRIRNCFGPEPERTSKYAPGWSLRFTEGEGDGRVDISTVNGGVKLCRK